MKVKDREHIRLRKMGSLYMIVNTSSAMVDMTNVYTLNESAAFLMEKACSVPTFDTRMLAEWLMEEYGIPGDIAMKDAEANAATWRELRLVEE